MITDRGVLAKKMNKLVTDIRELKFRQAIGGDSWIVYRTSLDYTDPGGGLNGHIFQVDFQPDTGGNFVAKAYWTSPDRIIPGIELSADPNVNGRWYVIDPAFGSVSKTIFVYSTKRGKIIMKDLSIPTPV